MRDRLCDVLAWINFAYSVWLLWWLFIFNNLPLGYIDPAWYSQKSIYESVTLLIDAWDWFRFWLPDTVMIFAIPPAIWVPLYILCGSPRILPWKRPEQVEEE